MPNTPKRKRGAPAGNLNALKHGFYSAQFRKKEIEDLKTTSSTERSDPPALVDLMDEIAMLRVFTRRVLELAEDAADLPDRQSLLRSLCLSTGSITRMLNTQRFLVPVEDPWNRAINEALRQLAVERDQTQPQAPPEPDASQE